MIMLVWERAPPPVQAERKLRSCLRIAAILSSLSIGCLRASPAHHSFSSC